MTKEVFFKYTGGDETVSFNVNSITLPLRYEIAGVCDWIGVNIKFNAVTIKVTPTYDYKDREHTVSVFNSNNSRVDLIIRQEGFKGIDMQCDEMVVLSHSYYDMSEYYNFYVTVYGGKTQDLICKPIQKQISMVWDNSDMYNDFIIKIPKGLSGTFTLKHSEYSNYKKYCKENGIEFDERKVKRNLEIVQIDEKDTIGEISVEYDGTIYKSPGIIPVVISNDNQASLKILSTRYMHQLSMTKYELIDTRQVDINECPSWLSVKVNGDKIDIKANGRNNFSDMVYRMKVTNRTNSHQFIYVDIRQESGT